MAFKLFNANSKIVQMHEKIEATLDAIPDLLFEVGLDGYYYDIHAHDAQLLFKPAAELIGRRMQEVLPSSIADTMMSAVVEAYEKGSSSGRQYELTVPAGQFWFELSVSIKARDSEDPRFIILARNITERKQFERAIQEKESHFESLFANAPVGIVYSTLEGKIISINAEYARILGYASPEEAKELINQTSLSEAVYASPKNRAILLDQIRNAPGSWVRTEQPFRRKDGDIVVAKAVFRASPDNCEVLEGFLEESSLPRQ
jgi:PAS domain S-box-containing protein